jgi:hypothetical protein
MTRSLALVASELPYSIPLTRIVLVLILSLPSLSTVNRFLIHYAPAAMRSTANVIREPRVVKLYDLVPLQHPKPMLSRCAGLGVAIVDVPPDSPRLREGEFRNSPR